MVPVPSAAAQSTRHSNDLMRHMRERLYVMRSSCVPVPPCVAAYRTTANS